MGPCGSLIFNLDEDGRPIPGAPDAKFISSECPRVCSLCAQLHFTIVEDKYWQHVQTEERERYERTKKLGPGRLNPPTT